MSLEKKYNSIDQSKLKPAVRDILKKMKEKSDDFTNSEINKKVEPALDKLLMRLEKELPEAIKKATKTPSKPKAKPKAKATPKTKSTKETFTQKASKLMKQEGISWAEAKNKLSKQLKDEKDKVEKDIKSDNKQALNQLDKIINSTEFKKDLGKFPKKEQGKERTIKSNASNDGKRQALPRGKRLSKNGKTYYEYRDNRSDVNSLPASKGQFKYKGQAPPYLEAGGTLPTPFGQAGLVGETGAMNEMDLFAIGGDLPQGVHQYYANTYNPAYPTPQGYAKGGMIEYSKDGVVKVVRNIDKKILKEINVNGVTYRRNPTYKTYNSVKNNELLTKKDYAKGGETIDGFTLNTIKGIANKPTNVDIDKLDINYAEGGALNSLKKQMNDDLDIHSEYYAKGGEIKSQRDIKKIFGKSVTEVQKTDEGNYIVEGNLKEIQSIADKKGINTESMENWGILIWTNSSYAEGGKVNSGYYVEWFEDMQRNVEEFDANELDEAKDFYNFIKSEKFYYEKPKVVLTSIDNDEVIMGKKFAKGGRTISIVNDGVKFDKSKYKAVYGDFDKDGIVNIDDANPLNKNKKGNVEQIELRKTFDKLLGVKAELDEIMYDAVDTLDKKAPKGADIYARTKTPYSILKKLVEKRMLDPKRGLTDMIGTTIAVENQKELVELRDKIDNGLLGKVLDRDDFYKRPNAGYRAYHYIVEYKGVPVEVQLKTKNMKKLHEVSHEAYKEGNLNPKSLNAISIVFMKADKGDAKYKVEMKKLLSNKKQLISKVSN
jgi:ppGpp synthetase/RelA/SpoT-type nucleotidyltranferase